jgi:hypothetical protein
MLLHHRGEGPCPAENTTEPARKIEQEATEQEMDAAVVTGPSVAESMRQLMKEYRKIRQGPYVAAVVSLGS